MNNNKTLVAPSLLSADFSQLGEEVRAVEKAGADWIHIDVMDGHFVPNLTIGPMIIKSLKPHTSLPFDVHLMIENPDQYIPEFANAGADIITVHVEASRSPDRSVSLIKSLGKRAGISLNPSTGLETIENILAEVNMVLIMSVNPGFGGQSFIDSSLDRAVELKRMVNDLGLNIDIEIDGGIKPGNAARVRQAGANVLVAGSAIFGSEDYKKAISEIRG
ncbi:MAG TPA: ribulose-phosphate 3-epimerase [Nitrospinota bacterium]|nr:ribulose-phosphate 3-epimerase [Nitrospinota bacterium]|tara:strand:+ start:29479 stop:30135 length:657 start_codon:yes stop_codon:yes gene_type:complete